MSMPGWAMALGGLMEAPKVASNWMGLWKNVNDIREENSANDALAKLEQFRTPGEAEAYRPEGYMRPDTRMKLEKLRQDKLDALYKQAAAPTMAEASRLNTIAATDPTVGSEEGLADFASRPGFWLDQPAGSANPDVATALGQFGNQNLNTLDAFRATGGDRMSGARISLDKNRAIGFKDIAQGMEQFAKRRDDSAEQAANEQINSIVAGYPLERNVDSWNGLVEKLRRIPGAKPGAIDAVLKDMASRNQAPAGVLNQRVVNGPNSTVSEVKTDMFGEPVTGTHVTSTNNPSDRELGLTGGDSGSGTLDVSWIGPDGTPQSAIVERSQIATLKSSLKAQGVKELHTVDGKRASRTEVLTKPEKGKRSIMDSLAPGGAAPAAPAASGGYKFVNGQLVPN